ncbi:MAG: hypothetical protein V4598_12405 [Bdellovibrionota bacterium]
MIRLLILAGLFLCASLPTGKVIVSSPVMKKIFIGVDGVSRDDFYHAQEKLGLFPTLRFTKTHIATFPSISDYSWNVMVNARKVFGPRGRVGTYEAAHFDRERNELVTDPREYFRRLGEEHHYFTGAFEHWLNPFVESLLYIPTEELPKLELKQLLAAVKNDPDQLVTVMIASSDALAHTRPDGSKFLLELDKFITDLETHYAEQNVKAEIILVSDHGQASRFLPGENPKPLLGVNLQGVFKRAGLNVSTKLSHDSDVVMPVMALANYGSVFFADQAKRDGFVSELRKENWFSFAAFRREIAAKEVKLSVFDGNGEAFLTIRNTNGLEYFYETVSSNPLQVPDDFHSRWMSDSEARKSISLTEFPDSFHRLAFSAFEEEATFPDVLFTLKDEFFLAGELNSFTTMYQTHGSLGRRSSSGIVTSNYPLQSNHDELRTDEILSAVGITPEEIFASTKREVLPAVSGEIATGSENWDNRRIFALMNRGVQDSRYVFEAKSFDVILGVVKPLLNQKSPELPTQKLKEAMSLADAAHLVDLMIKNGNIDKIQTDPKFLQIKARLAATSTDSRRSPSNDHHQHAWEDKALIQRADAAKKIAMKSYSSMFLLEKAMTLPEMPMMTDLRDHESSGSQDIQKVFSETFKERSMLREIFPEKFSLLWEPKVPGEEFTLVYVPGIYNSLFDDEIFRSGLDHLKHKWGMRIITPSVFSTCSSQVNGKIIMDEIRKDADIQISRGKTSPKYFVMGYSKGGVDALHGFSQDTKFVSQYIEGLITIASPIKGSSILNKTDLPLEVMNVLGHEKAPAICKTEERAAKSVTPAGAQAFLRKSASELIGLTRYYSLSFTSDIKTSHLFMRATKNIGRFGEPNDGVVALSASKFPEDFGAIDLGVVNADHLSGIVASHFPHEAFMESVLFTLTRSGAFDSSHNRMLNEKILYHAKKSNPERHLSVLTNKIGKLVSSVFLSDSDVTGVGGAIRKSLKNSEYKLSPFSLIRRKGQVHVSFHDGRWPSFTGGNLLPVKNQEELTRIFLTSLQASGRNLLKSNRKIVPTSDRPAISPPSNELGFQEDLRINVRELDKFISGKKVVPVTYVTHPDGFAFTYDHSSSAEFRTEYQLSFEDSAPPEADDHAVSGWETFIDRENKVWARLASTSSSIRLSSYSWRFLANEYPELDLEIQVNDDVEGANVLFGGDGKDDSAFQLWFTFRILDDQKKREYLNPEEKMMTIGYYFGDQIAGKNLELNQIYLNYYSEKDFVVAKLPPARQKLIGIGKDMMGKPLITRHNLLEDIRASYPDVDPMKAEIVAITIQHDSNDTRGKSEALFRKLALRPRLQRTVKAD